jgi:hypothetical protein
VGEEKKHEYLKNIPAFLQKVPSVTAWIAWQQQYRMRKEGCL